MNDLEERIRTGLRSAAAGQSVPAGYERRVARRTATIRRRRTMTRAAAAAIVTVALAAAALAWGRSPETNIAGSPPAAAGWRPIDRAPIPPRFQHLEVAMGEKVLVWGGYSGHTMLDGAVYDTTKGSWVKVPAAPFRTGDAIGAWTGHEAIVLAGDGGDVRAAAYDPATNTWRTLAPPPLENAASALNHALWTGTRLIVVGIARQSDAGTTNQLATFDPSTGIWSRGSAPPVEASGDAVWTGHEVAVVGHVGTSGKSAGVDSLQVYNPATDEWRVLPWRLSGLRSNPVVAWTGTRLFIGGGSVGDRSTALSDGALVDLATDGWDGVPAAPIAFHGNERYGELWTGTEVLTLGGDGDRPVAFDPAARTWRVGPASPDAAYRDDAPWEWVAPAQSAFVWGGGASEGGVSCCTAIAGGRMFTP